jgi:hypothetical protein
MFQELALLLQQYHYRNRNGCWLTDYMMIPSLVVHASTTNGTSGLGVYKGNKVYWSMNPDNSFTVTRN